MPSGTKGRVRGPRGTPRRLSRTRRGVLEGLPLSILMSIIIIAIGTVVLLGIYQYAQGVSLSAVYASTPAVAGTFTGFLTLTPVQLEITALARTGGTLGGVDVVLNGSGVSEQGVTSSNGTVFFWVQPFLREHATSGVLEVTASYDAGVSLVVPPHQTYALALEVLS